MFYVPKLPVHKNTVLYEDWDFLTKHVLCSKLPVHKNTVLYEDWEAIHPAHVDTFILVEAPRV
jgi:hypothetical protein